MKVNGIHLKAGAVIVLSPHTQETESPSFAFIKEIFILPTKEVLLGVKMIEVLDYSTHYHSWLVKHTDNNHVVNFRDLYSPQVLHARSSNYSFGIVKLLTLKYVIL